MYVYNNQSIRNKNKIYKEEGKFVYYIYSKDNIFTAYLMSLLFGRH